MTGYKCCSSGRMDFLIYVGGDINTAKDFYMRAFTKIWKVVVVMTLIATGLNACITITSAPPKTEEQLALEEVLKDTLMNASWKAERLANPPSLDGAQNIAKFGYTESEMAMNMDVESVTVGTIVSSMNLDLDTWYALTAPELPGITYYSYRPSGFITVGQLYKREQ